MKKQVAASKNQKETSKFHTRMSCASLPAPLSLFASPLSLRRTHPPHGKRCTHSEHDVSTHAHMRMHAHTCLHTLTTTLTHPPTHTHTHTHTHVCHLISPGETYASAYSCVAGSSDDITSGMRARAVPFKNTCTILGGTSAKASPNSSSSLHGRRGVILRA